MENYEMISEIGKGEIHLGSFGSIFKAKRNSTQEYCVIKEILYANMTEKEKEQLVAEANILKNLNHPNIVKYYDR